MKNLDLLKELFPNKVTLSIDEVAGVLGISTSSIYHKRCSGDFRLREVKIKGKVLYPILAVAEWLDGKTPAPPKKNRGRPTKKEQEERQLREARE